MAFEAWLRGDPKAVLRRSAVWMLVSLLWIALRYDDVRRVQSQGVPASYFQVFTILFWVATLIFWMVIGGRSWLVWRRGAGLLGETACRRR